MAPEETPGQRASRQLEALMKRHDVKNAAEFERKMAERHYEPVISQVTIRRILKNEVRTEPERGTLRRLAEFLGETLDKAFPEREIGEVTVVNVDGQEIEVAFKSRAGGPMDPATLEKLKQRVGGDLSVDAAEATHKAKQSRRRSS